MTIALPVVVSAVGVNGAPKGRRELVVPRTEPIRVRGAVARGTEPWLQVVGADHLWVVQRGV